MVYHLRFPSFLLRYSSVSLPLPFIHQIPTAQSPEPQRGSGTPEDLVAHHEGYAYHLFSDCVHSLASIDAHCANRQGSMHEWEGGSERSKRCNPLVGRSSQALTIGDTGLQTFWTLCFRCQDPFATLMMYRSPNSSDEPFACYYVGNFIMFLVLCLVLTTSPQHVLFIHLEVELSVIDPDGVG